MRIPCKIEQQLKLVRPVERTVCHMIYHHGKFGVGFDEWHKVRKPCNRRKDRHWNLEVSAPPPERRHQRSANPVAFCRSRGAETDSPESIFCKLTKMIWRFRVFRIYAAHPMKEGRITLQDTCQVTIVPSVVNHLDNNRARDAVGPHEINK